MTIKGRFREAGAGGSNPLTPTSPTDNFDIADTYRILFDLGQSHDFIEATGKADGVRMAIVVTDDHRVYQAVCAELPALTAVIAICGASFRIRPRPDQVVAAAGMLKRAWHSIRS